MLPAPAPPPLPNPSGGMLALPTNFKESPRRRCWESEISAQMEASKLCERLFGNQPCLSEDQLWISLYCRVLPVLQEGPSCGLAALCMAGQLIKDEHKSPHVVALGDAIEVARKRGYTCRGEMFSASNMRDLAEELLSCNVELLSTGFEQRSKIIHHLSKGLPILVPYDADANHEPCCKQGHKAHWAVLLGLVFKTSSSDALSCQTFKVDPLLSWLYHGHTGDYVESIHTLQEKVIDLATYATEVYVYAKQGKSSHTGLWNFENLASSNANLHEVSPKRRDSIHQYIIPENGICSGLCRQILLFG